MSKIQFMMPVIFVEDVKRSREFYQNIFSLEVEMDFGENIVFKDAFSIWQRSRAMSIIFDNINLDEKINNYRDIELYFETLDIESVWEKVRSSNLEIIHPIKEESWGQRVFRLYDPDKHIIEVAEPMSEVVIRFHKAGLSEENISIKTQMPKEIIRKIISK